jgi:hypothetical protein
MGPWLISGCKYLLASTARLWMVLVVPPVGTVVVDRQALHEDENPMGGGVSTFSRDDGHK